MFKIVQSMDDPERVSVTRYTGVITEPPENTRLSCYAYNPAHNFFLTIKGRVTPKPPTGTVTSVAIQVPLLGGANPGILRFEAPLDDSGNFSINPSMSIPPVYPYVQTKMFVLLSNSETEMLVSEAIEVWFKDFTKEHVYIDGRTLFAGVAPSS